jgi:hypothetical protein
MTHRTDTARTSLPGKAALVALLAAGLLAMASPGPASASDPCPNEARRVEQRSAFLPDCRAYEMVSPVDKNNGDILPESTLVHAAADGHAVSFASLTGFADAVGTGTQVEYMSVRDATSGTTGWSTHAITPPQEPLSNVAVALKFMPLFVGDFSEDLSSGVFSAWSPLGTGAGEENVRNTLPLYVRHDLSTAGAGSYQLVSESANAQPLMLPKRQWLAGASSDFSHVLFESVLDLTPDASGHRTKLYEWDEGEGVRLVGILPDGTPAESSMAGQGAEEEKYTPHTISADGSRAFFTDPATNDLYMRIDGKVTFQLNASELETPEAPGAAQFWTASDDGSRAFFTTAERLIEDDHNPGRDLYMWARAAGDETQTVTVDATGGSFALRSGGSTTALLPLGATAAEVQAALEALPEIGAGDVAVTGGPASSSPYLLTFAGALAGVGVAELESDSSALTGGTVTVSVSHPVHNLSLVSAGQPGDYEAEGVSGASADGSSVYFTATGKLLPGQPSFNEHAGVFVWHEGDIKYVGWLSNPTDADLDTGVNPYRHTERTMTARVSPNGRYLLFMSGSDEGLRGQGGYGGSDHGTTCTLESSVGIPCRELYIYDAQTGRLRCASCVPNGAVDASDALVETHIATGAALYTSHLSHALSDDGRFVFFDTADPLVPQDVNGKRDVYEYDFATETVHLISSGRGTSDSYFMDASASGEDVFFLTNERLVGFDSDENYDLYDARAGGGVPEPPGQPPACAGESCQPPLSAAPPGASYASATVTGAGDPQGAFHPPKPKPKPCRRGMTHKKVGGHLKCVRRRRHDRTATARKQTRGSSVGRRK